MLERIATSRRAVDDLTHGQIVIIVARWILVMAGLLLAMWNPASLTELRVEIFVLLSLAVVNFYLHTQLVVKRISRPAVVYLASALDLTVVTLLILVQGGYDSTLHIFYFPAVLGYAVAFPRLLTAIYTAGAAAAYGLIGLSTAVGVTEVQDVVIRVLMLVAVAACGSVYLGVESNRRRGRLRSPVRADADAAGGWPGVREGKSS